MERVWGGRHLETVFGKQLPAGGIYGESWEIADRPEGVSRIVNGKFAGRDLRWLMKEHERELLGTSGLGRFPLLIKILDAREKLSLQVHPPTAIAAEMGGEPKTEMWHVIEAEPDAELYVGLRPEATRASFESALQNGTVAQCFHRVKPKAGESMFLPSGRVHAIGAGFVLFEIQQNSDTTYRVFDWNRVDKNGKSRPLHVAESMRCIDFADKAPRLIPEPTTDGAVVVKNDLFKVVLRKPPDGVAEELKGGVCRILAMIDGELQVRGGGETVNLTPGTFAILPASVESAQLESKKGCRFLEVEPGETYVPRS
jgi:mannose-6-phosphate isomerase